MNLLRSLTSSPSSITFNSEEALEELLPSSAVRSDSNPPKLQRSPSEGKILGRTVSWLTRTKSDASIADTKPVSRDALLTSIRTTYDSDIAEKVESFHSSGLTQRGSNDRLSKETIDSANAFANFLEKSHLDSANLATSKQSINHVEKLYYRAALDVLKSSGLKTDGTALEKKLETANAEASDSKNKNIVFDVTTAEKHILNARKEAESLLSNAIQTSSLDPQEKKTALAAASSSFKKALVSVLNKQEWPVVETTLQYSIGKQTITSESVMTPASKMVSLQKAYAAEGVGGICSGDKTNQEHAINLLIDRLEHSSAPESSSSSETASITSSEDSHETFETSSLQSQEQTDAAPKKPIITLIRSGVHFPESVEPSKQEAAFNKRFNEALLASLESKGLLPTASSTEPIKITIADVGLLSGSIEHTMQQGQFTNLAKVNAQTAQGTARELRYTPPGSDQEVVFSVQPTVLAFNFGVRKLDKGVLAIATEPSAWKQTNNESFDQLLGSTTSKELGGLVQEALSDANRTPPLTEKDKKAIQDLAQQCRDIRQEGSLNTNDNDYYAVAARVIVLCDKLGIVPNIHCKSGKDRTSRAVEEAKMLAAEIEATGEVPLRGKLSSERQAVAQVFAQSGNAKLQQLNTGLIGNKQGKAFNLRVDHSLAQTFYAGLSAHTAT